MITVICTSIHVCRPTFIDLVAICPYFEPCSFSLWQSYIRSAHFLFIEKGPVSHILLSIYRVVALKFPLGELWVYVV